MALPTSADTSGEMADEVGAQVDEGILVSGLTGKDIASVNHKR